jgi:hypothetical protein
MRTRRTVIPCELSIVTKAALYGICWLLTIYEACSLSHLHTARPIAWSNSTGSISISISEAWYCIAHVHQYCIAQHLRAECHRWVLSAGVLSAECWAECWMLAVLRLSAELSAECWMLHVECWVECWVLLLSAECWVLSVECLHVPELLSAVRSYKHIPPNHAIE